MCASCDCKCRPGRPERGCDCKCKSCNAARESVGKRLFRGKLIARKTAEVTAANADEVRRAFAAGVGDAEAAAMRVTGRAEQGVRRGAFAAGAALAGGLTVPVVVNHVMAGRRERRRVAKGFQGIQGVLTMGNQMSERSYLFGSSTSLAELSKAMNPNKLRALRAVENRGTSGAGMRERRDNEYARNRLAAYRVGANSPVNSASPSVQEAFRRKARDSAWGARYKSRNVGEGRRIWNGAITNSTGRAGGYDQSVAARRARMNDGFRSRPILP